MSSSRITRILGAASIALVLVGTGVAIYQAQSSAADGVSCHPGTEGTYATLTNRNAPRSDTPERALLKAVTRHQVPDAGQRGLWIPLPHTATSAPFFRGTGMSTSGTPLPGHSVRGDTVVVVTVSPGNQWTFGYTEWTECPLPGTLRPPRPPLGTTLTVSFPGRGGLDPLNLAHECLPEAFTAGGYRSNNGALVHLTLSQRPPPDEATRWADCVHFHQGTIR